MPRRAGKEDKLAIDARRLTAANAFARLARRLYRL